MNTMTFALTTGGEIYHNIIWPSLEAAVNDARRLKELDPTLSVWILNAANSPNGREVK